MLNKPLAYMLCLFLALQGGLAVLLQHQQLSAIKATTQADIELICTGAEMKFISVSLTEQLGEFVFVDGPENINKRLLDNTCPAGAMSDMQPSIALLSDAVHNSFSRYLAIKLDLQQRPYTAHNYQTAQSRAPPIV